MLDLPNGTGIGQAKAAMNERGIGADFQEKIVTSIDSFALYGFPESHAISFALIAVRFSYKGLGGAKSRDILDGFASVRTG